MEHLITSLVNQIKTTKPLLLNMTNVVTMDMVANGLLALGASPVMSQAIQEIDDLCSLAQAVIVNPGTLDEAFKTLAQHTCEIATAHNKPIIFDPVGVGASAYRTSFAQQLLKHYPIRVIRGNASEIMALAGVSIQTKGVDSSSTTDVALDAAQQLASTYNTVVVISGAIDRVVSAQDMKQFERGSAMMPCITGSGCLLTAVVGAFVTVAEDPFIAASAATLFYAICGEQAAHKANGPGTFKAHFFDALYHASMP